MTQRTRPIGKLRTIAELADLWEVSPRTIQRLIQSGALRCRRIGRLDADEEPRVQIASPDEDLGWSMLKEFLEADGKTLRDLICDLKLGLLD
jgi:excisionase family DNA binding protein